MMLIKKRFLAVTMCAALSITPALSVFASNDTSASSAEISSEEAVSEISYEYLTVNEDGTRTFEDMKGNVVTVPSEADMDSMLTVAWPGNQPTLALLQLQDMIPAWSTTLSGDNLYWAHQYNPSILEKPSVGNEAEEIMNYDPDIVFVKSNDVYEELTAAGLTASVMTPSTLDDVLHSVLLTAEISGRQEAIDRADEYIDYYNEVVEDISNRLASVDENDYQSVYFINGQHGDTPLLTDGTGNRLSAFASICGFKLATEDIGKGDQIEITAEQLMEINPDIICIYGLNAYDCYANLMADESLAALDAVKEGKVYFVPKGGQPMNGTGVENVMYIQWQAKTLYPELFEDYDMVQIIHDFYQNFMNHEFSESDIQAMLEGKNMPDA